MKKVCILILVAGMTGIFSCSKVMDPPSENPENGLNMLKAASLLEKEKAEYDKNIRKFARALAKSLKMQDFRKLVKNEALRKRNGDYAILWKDLNSEFVNINNIRKPVFEFVAENVEEIGKTKAEKIKDIEEFGNTYWKLQIAVPVNCDKWDVASFQPLVAFLSSDYSEGQDIVQAYDNKGNIVTLNNKQAPDFPVIVISMNERMSENDNLKLKSSEIFEELVSPPTNLTGYHSTNGNFLTWQYSLPSESKITEIFRDSGYGFSQIGTVSSYIMEFVDMNVLAEKDYYYKIRVYDSSSYVWSSFSNSIIVSTSTYPKEPASFSSVNFAPNMFLLKWINQQEYTNGSIIRSRVFNASLQQWSNWETVTTVSNNTDLYIDEVNYYSGRNYLPQFGQKIHYQVRSLNNYGESKNGTYDVVYNAERSDNQVLGLRGVYVPKLSDIEPWTKGNPEFKINVATMNDIGNVYIVNSNTDLQTRDRSGIYTVTSQLVSAWSSSFMKSVMSVNVNEYDDDLFVSKITYKFDALKFTKDPVQGLTNLLSGGTGEVSAKSHDRNCGTAYVKYWDDPVKTYTINYGIKLTFTNNLDVVIAPR